MQAFSDVATFHRNLYEKAYAEASAQSSMTAPSIKTYAKNFEASLPAKFHQIPLRGLLDRLDGSDLLLFGDFHTLKQSQLALLRTLNAYRLLKPDRPIILALEMFKARDSVLVQKYLRGTLDEAGFLKAVAYESDWGFPWKNYKPILDFARRHGIAVKGVNTKLGGKEALHKRDTYAAECLVELHKKNPKALIVNLIGEFHLADNHLPFAIKREMVRRKTTLTWTRVVTNVDQYFFAHPSLAPQTATEILYLKDDFYSIQNTPPWIKWQTFTLWEEMRAVQGYGLDNRTEDASFEEYYTEESFDLDYQIMNMIRDVGPVLGIPVSKREVQDINVMFAPDEPALSDFCDRHGFSDAFFSSVAMRLSIEGFVYVASRKTFIVNEVSLNNLAQLVGYHLFYVRVMDKDLSQKPSAIFVRRVLATMASTLTSKIVNPQRSHFTLIDYTRMLYSTSRKRLTGYAVVKRETAKRLISFVSSVKQGKSIRMDASARFDTLAGFDLSIALGNLLGSLSYEYCLSQTKSENPWAAFFTIAAMGDEEQAEFLRRVCEKLLV